MPTVFVVDDSATEREIISGCLKSSGLTIITAESGEEALDKIGLVQPDVIILDVVLPGRSGFEVCRELKAEDSTSKIPVIICSTKGTEMDKFWGLKQGADAYITKPIDQEELVKTVNKLL